MKQFVAAIYLVGALFYVLNTGGQAKGSVITQNQAARQTSTDNYFNSAGFYFIFNNAANKISFPGIQKRFPVLFQKFPVGAIFSGKFIEVTNILEISGILHIAKHDVIRLEGPDLIHPFNYFW